MIRLIRAVLPVCGAGLLGAAAAVFGAHWWIQRAAGRYVIGRPADLPLNDVALVLGTSAFTRGHARNPHFEHRITAAAQLFQAGRVRHLLLSGDNGTRGYDEPAEMQQSLEAQGIPATSLTRDDAGFRTLDSMVRARKVFGLRRLTIVTDRFHCARAVFLARHFGLEAVAYPSEEVSLQFSLKSRLREWLADVKACLDVYVLHTQPKFLGPPIKIKLDRDQPRG